MEEPASSQAEFPAADPYLYSHQLPLLHGQRRDGPVGQGDEKILYREFYGRYGHKSPHQHGSGPFRRHHTLHRGVFSYSMSNPQLDEMVLSDMQTIRTLNRAALPVPDGMMQSLLGQEIFHVQSSPLWGLLSIVTAVFLGLAASAYPVSRALRRYGGELVQLRPCQKDADSRL